jgi:hypothetical protein
MAALDDVTIPTRTGTATRLDRRLSNADLAELHRQEGVEFAQIYLTGPGRNGGGGQTLLIRGNDRGVRIPVGPNVRIINHSHPRMLDGSVVPLRASLPDRQTMEALRRSGSPQRLSRIVTEEGHVIDFTEFRARLRLQQNGQ